MGDLLDAKAVSSENWIVKKHRTRTVGAVCDRVIFPTKGLCAVMDRAYSAVIS